MAAYSADRDDGVIVLREQVARVSVGSEDDLLGFYFAARCG